ncbi:AraC family transcriptional regulator [Flavobacterium paronense]|uniref:Helix-turn-helix domain-containing protein n=1 Tax=Flavobacterium paronense TaxID=1392775 RepID=A0ABV5GE88_9FLAO|nr:AraC family transcriptional regulator [Flavobacterium paronense]MDN3678240.1 AraC family transcriptional regulator [Flavobacterium paronense]
MDATILLVKNMVCQRCVMAVEAILAAGSIAFQKVTFGEIHLSGALSAEQKAYLKESLDKVGFEMIDSQTGGIVEKIKQLVIKRARNEVPDAERKIKLSLYLSDKVHHEYTYLSSLFSAVEGRTIENYFIEQRIEKAKELLIYDQLTLAEIAFELEYSSAAHLSNQFKKITGLTPTYFKAIGSLKRKALDKI